MNTVSSGPDSGEQSCWLGDLLRGRHSVRSFLPDPVPEAVITEVFDTARWAPSNNNSQPWHVSVVSGAARDTLENLLLALVDAGEQPSPAFLPSAAGFGPEHQARAKQNGEHLGTLMDIDPTDGESRARLMRLNWGFYGAPHVAFYSLPLSMGIANGVDLGLFIHAVVMQLTSRGIGVCLQGSLAAHPGPVHKVTEIPEGHGIVCGMSFGYPDPEARINRHRTDREPLEGVVRFHC